MLATGLALLLVPVAAYKDIRRMGDADERALLSNYQLWDCWSANGRWCCRRTIKHASTSPPTRPPAAAGRQPVSDAGAGALPGRGARLPPPSGAVAGA
ncbi:MAG: hypothetical protein Kow0073_09000 [Immundisolibacter sp.]